MKHLLKFQANVFAIAFILLISISSVLSAQKIGIIDAGSSGSRLYIYEIKDHKLNVLYPTSQAVSNKGRALSGVANHTDSIYAFLDTMTNKYMLSGTDSVDLYILATAGMRLERKSQADSIYSIIKGNATTLKRKKYNLKEAMTISGKYEGFYAWIAANYRNEKLKLNSRDSLTCSNDTTYGILEIGGASMQIAFKADNESDKDEVKSNWIKQLYSKSYLRGGVDQVFDSISYNRISIDKSYKFAIPLDSKNSSYNQMPKFYALGKPLEIVLDGAKNNDISSIRKYADSLSNKDSTDKYHPYTNVYYIAWVVDSLKLSGKLEVPQIKSDWTEGAALDILVNKERPEEFNYKVEN